MTLIEQWKVKGHAAEQFTTAAEVKTAIERSFASLIPNGGRVMVNRTTDGWKVRIVR